MYQKQIPYDGIANKEQYEAECAHANLAAEFSDNGNQNQTQEEEQHFHFVINDFSDLVKKYGAAKVYTWMDDATVFELWRVFLRGR
mgnify:CR=1 FL=1